MAIMLLAQKQSIEDLVAENLAKNPYSTGPQLVAMVNKTREDTTKQAVYTALKALIQSEVVAKVGHTYFLSRVWLTKIERLFQVQKEKELVRDAIFDLKDSESISYHFPNLLTCDTYWAHVFELLMDWMPENRPLCGYMPHEWFAIGREDVERNIFKAHEAKKKHMFYTIGGTTALDMLFKRRWQNAFVSVHVAQDIDFPRTYYLHVFEDFLIEVFVPEELARAIDAFYEQHTALTDDSRAFFDTLITQKSPVRMKISRKSKKAAHLRKKLLKHFYVPRNLNGSTMGAMKVLAIDPGYGRCGVAVVEKENGREQLLYSDCIETSGDDAFPERLAAVAAECARLLRLHAPDCMAIEKLFFAKNQKTAMHVAEVRGALIQIAAENDIPVFEYSPGEVKNATTGSGRADKQQIAAMVRLLIKMEKPVRHDDEYDAIAIGITHLARARAPLSK